MWFNASWWSWCRQDKDDQGLYFFTECKLPLMKICTVILTPLFLQIAITIYPHGPHLLALCCTLQSKTTDIKNSLNETIAFASRFFHLNHTIVMIPFFTMILSIWPVWETQSEAMSLFTLTQGLSSCNRNTFQHKPRVLRLQGWC